MKAKTFALLVLGFVLSMAVVACGGQPAAPAATTAPAAPAASKPATAAATAAPAATKPAAAAAVQKPANWPTRAIQLIIPANAGGGTDVGFRLLAPLMEKTVGQPIEVVNKPGAGTQIGVTELAKAKPDGYTIGNVSGPLTQ